ncbi:MAG TPA: class I SAM-dependent methyltransferase [Kofleriaceae bacterium]|nr:class I SAM-dependent methyltransferase [Kofleriaceae bacterium]
MTPDQLLRAYHARHPGATARAFADGRAPDGRSTYQLLADLPAPADAVLDLGCGDGHLLELLVARGCREVTGVDMSPEELVAADARPALAGVRLLEARAQALPLPDASFDWVLSHMAFMLMSDVEVVVAELARVLRPGGRFAAVVGGGPAEEDDGFALFLGLYQVEHASLADPPPRIGDRRTREAAGFASLFHPGTGFAAGVEEIALTVRHDGSAERVWDIVASAYGMLLVAPDRRAAMRERFLAEAVRGEDGLVRCALRYRLLTAARAST